eukprot:1158661-Pelagomonas_calceolata.AAC.3
MMLEKISHGMATKDSPLLADQEARGDGALQLFEPVPPKVQEAFTEVLEKAYDEADEVREEKQSGGLCAEEGASAHNPSRST